MTIGVLLAGGPSGRHDLWARTIFVVVVECTVYYWQVNESYAMVRVPLHVLGEASYVGIVQAAKQIDDLPVAEKLAADKDVAWKPVDSIAAFDRAILVLDALADEYSQHLLDFSACR